MLKGLVSYESSGSDSDSEPESDPAQKTVVATSSQIDSVPPAKKIAKINLLNDLNIPELQITRKKFSNDCLTNKTKSGLLNLLPPVSKLVPKTAIKSTSTKTSLMPTTILKRKNLSDLNEEIESDTIESETLTNFFSFVETDRRTGVSDVAATIPKIVPDLCQPVSSNNNNNQTKSNAYFANLVNSRTGDKEDETEAEEAVQVEAADIMEKMPVDFRGSNGSISALDIIDVNADEITKENRLLMLRNLTDETTCTGGLQDFGSTRKRLKKDGSGGGGGGAGGAGDLGSLHRKKHQITFLAQQALENEQHLKNFWAANRHAQDQSRQKYGF